MDQVYRQRFTSTGYWGIALMVFCPPVLAIIMANFVDDVSSRYGSPDLFSYGFGLVLFSTGILVGLVMILIGREHYPFMPPGVPEVAKESAQERPVEADGPEDIEAVEAYQAEQDRLARQKV